MSKIWLEVVARPNVQRETTSTSRSTSNSQTTLQDKDDLKDEVQRRPKHRHTHKTTTPTRPSLVPPSKKTTFCRNFLFEDLELSKVFHIFAVRKTFDKLIRSTFTTSIHTHNRVFFETTRYLSNKGRVQNDGRRETKDWNIQRHRHEHQS